MSDGHVGRLAVLGLGLLGGSVAMAARQRGVADEIVCAGRRRAPLERALAAGVVDRIASPAEAVAGADLVLLGTPIGTMPELLADVAASLRPGSVVTDVGSVKGWLVDVLPGLLPDGVEFVGSHPMAGSHLRGVEHARADLLEGATCVVTPGADADARVVARVEAFWRALGARVKRRSAARHDQDVAWVSHLPHLLAFAYAAALEGAPDRVGELAGGGFRDFTRIALSDGELWGEILDRNAKALSGPLARFSASLASLARALEEGDVESLERLLNEARKRLTEVASRAAGGSQPVPERSAPKGSAIGDPGEPEAV